MGKYKTQNSKKDDFDFPLVVHRYATRATPQIGIYDQLCSHSHQNRKREYCKWIFIAGLQLYMSRLGEAEEKGMVWGMGTSGTSVVVWALV